MQMAETNTWQGRDLLGSDGEKIGTIKEIYEDSVTGKPEWALVSSGWFGTRSHFVPLAGAQPNGEGVRINATKDQVKQAPSIEGGGQLSEADEQRLFEHYNVPYTHEGSTTARTTPASEIAYPSADVGRPHTEDPHTEDVAMTRSEEDLGVGTTAQERGRARLRKYVVTEEVRQTAPVQHEEVRVEHELEHEPITGASVDAARSGPEISEAEHEVVVYDEEPMIEKRTVPKEHIRLATETVTDERETSQQVRKEQIEPEGDIRR